MDLQDLGSIGELIGALATVVTLAYLAVQVRQNSLQMRETTRITRLTLMDREVESFSRYRMLLVQPGIAEVFTRGLESYSTLAPADKVRFRAVIEEYFFSFNTLLERVAQGAYDPATWHAQASGAASLLDAPGAGEWWAERKFIFRRELIAEMEQRRAARSPAARTRPDPVSAAAFPPSDQPPATPS